MVVIKVFFRFIVVLCAFFIFLPGVSRGQVLLPVALADRTNLSQLQITPIGNFGIGRKARPKVPEHLHTGLDIMRPGIDFENAPVFPVLKGMVISKRTDGPYAQLIVEHFTHPKIWTVYEHVAGICVSVGDWVTPLKPIARFMNSRELNSYGWQFNHFHLEILKVKPLESAPTEKLPERFYKSYGLVCFDKQTLDHCYWSPIAYFKENLGGN